MFNSFKDIMRPEYENNWFWFIALLALSIEMLFHILLPISISSDSYGYYNLSRELWNPNILYQRTLGYSIFLLIFSNVFDSLIPVILIQAATAVAVPLLIFKTLSRFGLLYAIIGALISCLFFYNFVVSLYILTEAFYVFFIALYAYLMAKYFRNPRISNVLYVIGACWLIALLRVSGTIQFLSFLVGMGVFVVIPFIHNDILEVKKRLFHILIAVLVFVGTHVTYSQITDRRSSVIWPNFAFNWTLRVPQGGELIYYGILKPENGPAAKRLFSEIENAITKNPGNFSWMKSGSPEHIKKLKPGANGKYSRESIKILMNDLINNKHQFRSWWILNMLMHYHGNATVGLKLAGNAIIEAFITHPQIVINRLLYIWNNGFKLPFFNGITVNNVSLPTAYHQQINKEIPSGNDSAVLPFQVLPGQFKQWSADLFEHTGNDPIYKKFWYSEKFPTTYAGAYKNYRGDNLIGFGHYITYLGIQVLRLCWILLALGLVILPFAANKPLLASLLCASIISPIISVFISEVDLRHLLMCSPIVIITASFVIYNLVKIFHDIRQYIRGNFAR